MFDVSVFVISFVVEGWVGYLGCLWGFNYIVFLGIVFNEIVVYGVFFFKFVGGWLLGVLGDIGIYVVWYVLFLVVGCKD